MQRIFYNLVCGDTACLQMLPNSRQSEIRTHELLLSFGWSDEQRYHQQDVNEFSDQLADILE